MKTDKARDERTKKLIDYYKGLPGEFHMLKGVLCMTHPFDYPDPAYTKGREIFNSVMIAERMDEITSEQLAEGIQKKLG